MIFCAALFRTEAPGKRELHNTWSEILKASGDRGKRKGGRWRRPRSDSGGTTIPCLPLLLRRPPSPPPEFPSMAGECGQVELLDDVRRMVLPHGPRHHLKSRPSFLREERGGRRSRPKELLSRRTGASSPALFQRLPSCYRRLTGGADGQPPLSKGSPSWQGGVRAVKKRGGDRVCMLFNPVAPSPSLFRSIGGCGCDWTPRLELPIPSSLSQVRTLLPGLPLPFCPYNRCPSFLLPPQAELCPMPQDVGRFKSLQIVPWHI